MNRTLPFFCVVAMFATTFAPAASAQNAAATTALPASVIQHSIGISLESAVSLYPAFNYDIRFRTPDPMVDFAASFSFGYLPIVNSSRSYSGGMSYEYSEATNVVGGMLRVTTLIGRKNWAFETGLEASISNQLNQSFSSGNPTYTQQFAGSSVGLPIGVRYQSPNSGVMCKFGLGPAITTSQTDTWNGAQALYNLTYSKIYSGINVVGYLTVAYTFNSSNATAAKSQPK